MNALEAIMWAAALMGSGDASDAKVAIQDAIPVVQDIAQNPYLGAARMAVKRRVPLIVFVRCPEVKVEGAVTLRVDSLPGYSGPTVVVSVPDGKDWLTYVSEFDPRKVTVSQLRIAAGLEVRPVQAATFQQQQPFRFVQQASRFQNCPSGG